MIEIRGIQINIFYFICHIMSYQSAGYQSGNSSINQYIPGYVVKSDFLPTRVVDGNSAQTAQLLQQYEEEKRRGRVFTQRPADFNPNRYASFKVYEQVRVDQPMDEQAFSRVVRR